jgi:Tfp pilus assembly protein PilE
MFTQHTSSDGLSEETQLAGRVAGIPSALRIQQGGFDLFSLLIGVVILGILGAIVLGQYSGDSSKAVSLFTSMANTADSLNRMKADTGSYPTRLAVLWNRTQATAANSYSGLAGTNSWGGPYLEAQAVDATSGAMLLGAIGDGVQVTIAREAGGNLGFYYYLRASNITNAIISEALKKCNGSDATTATFAAGKCRATPGAAATENSPGSEIGTFDLKIAESR